MGPTEAAEKRGWFPLHLLLLLWALPMIPDFHFLSHSLSHTCMHTYTCRSTCMLVKFRPTHLGVKCKFYFCCLPSSSSSLYSFIIVILSGSIAAATAAFTAAAAAASCPLYSLFKHTHVHSSISSLSAELPDKAFHNFKALKCDDNQLLYVV